MVAADMLASGELVFGEVVGGEAGCRWGGEYGKKSMRKDEVVDG
ncbi:hypothetical protein [Bartonella quintana]|nr:hypothetical protein [Bartonella quintana]